MTSLYFAARASVRSITAVVLGLAVWWGTGAMGAEAAQMTRAEASQAMEREIRQAHAALLAQNAEAAFQALNRALEIMHRYKTSESGMADIEARVAGAEGAMPEPDPVQAQLQFMLDARAVQLEGGIPPEQQVKIIDPEYQREIARQEMAASILQRIEAIRALQEEIRRGLEVAAEKEAEDVSSGNGKGAAKGRKEEGPSASEEDSGEEENDGERGSGGRSAKGQGGSSGGAGDARGGMDRSGAERTQSDGSGSGGQGSGSQEGADGTEGDESDGAHVSMGNRNGALNGGSPQKSLEGAAAAAPGNASQRAGGKQTAAGRAAAGAAAGRRDSREGRGALQAEKTGKQDGRASGASRSQREAAEQARNLANQAQELQNLDQRFAEVSRQLEDAAQSMAAAANLADGRELGNARAMATLAEQKLQEAMAKLAPIQAERLTSLLERLETGLRQLVDRAEALGGDLQQQKKKDGAATAGTAATPLRKSRVDQQALSRDYEALKQTLEEARALAAGAGYAVAAEKLGKIARANAGADPVTQRMAQAQQMLERNDVPGAAAAVRESRTQLSALLEQVQDAIHQTVADYESELKRAADKGARLQTQLQRLAGRSTDPAGSSGDMDGASAAGGAGGSAQRPPDGAQSASQRRAVTDDLAYRLRIWGEQLAARDLGDADARKQLMQAAADPALLATRLLQMKPGDTLLQTVDKLANGLAADYQAAVRDKKIRDAEREECPPRYRKLVSEYFEALSRIQQ